MPTCDGVRGVATLMTKSLIGEIKLKLLRENCKREGVKILTTRGSDKVEDWASTEVSCMFIGLPLAFDRKAKNLFFT